MNNDFILFKDEKAAKQDKDSFRLEVCNLTSEAEERVTTNGVMLCTYSMSLNFTSYGENKIAKQAEVQMLPVCSLSIKQLQ